MNIIDRLLEPFAPGVVVQRLAARQAIRAYEAAKPGRTHKAKGQTKSADLALQTDAASLRAQCRKLDEDHDIVTGLFDRLEERVVGGAGIGVEPLPLTWEGEVHLELAAEIKSAWSEWSLHPETSGELTRPQMERLVCRTWLRDGEALGQQLRGRVANYSYLTAVPYAIELLEADHLPWEFNDPGRGIVQGIERDAWRRKRAYHLFKQHPGSANVAGFSLSTKRVEAERILHIAYRKRIGQNRGVPLLHAALIRIADLKDYEESERVAARISAALAMYIKKGNPDLYTGTNGDNQAPGYRSFPIAPGMVIDDLLPGEEIGTIASNRPNTFLEGFRNGQLRAVAASGRSAYSTVARSYDGTYSAQRQELVEAQLGYDLVQHEFIDYWARPVYRNWLSMYLLTRGRPLPADVDPSTVYAAVYQGPVMPWINPKHEADSWESLVKAGFADEAEVARARGRNPQELKRTRAAEIATNREKGLVFSSDAAHAHKGLTSVEAIQKAYLGVGKMVSADEARKLVNDATGAGLPIPGPNFSDTNEGGADAQPQETDDPAGADGNGTRRGNAE